MSTQTLTLHLPDPLYARLQERARQFNRTLEAELLEVLNSAVPVEESLPDSLAEAVARLDGMDDSELWQAAKSRLTKREAALLEILHLKRQKEGLSESEASNLAELVQQYERSMLVRARAAALLKQRGCDLSGFAVKS
jgi:plasmid stability protein